MILRNFSIRLRLTLWNAAVLMVILSVVSLGIYFFMRNRLESMVRSKLDSGYATVEAVIRNSMGDIMDVYHLGQIPMFQLTQYDKVVCRTQAWKDAQLTDALDDEHFNPDRLWLSAEGRLYKLKMGTVPEYGYEIVFTQDATTTIESINSLVVILIAGIPCALILAILGGYFLAGRALSPANNQLLFMFLPFANLYKKSALRILPFK